MAITRSRNKVAGIALTASSKAKAKANPIESKIKTHRSVATAVKSKTVIASSLITGQKISGVRVTVPKTETPVVLPESFVSSHKPTFIAAINHILSVDPTLMETIISTPWGKYAIDETSADINSLTTSVDIPSDIGELDPLAYLYWEALVRTIISQQVSGAAAKSIRAKLYGYFDNAITPQKVLQAEPESLRGCGLSNAKVKYVRDVSEKFTDVDSPLRDPQWYKKALLEEIVEELVKIKGIGIWSAKMFAAFNLHEPDVFAEEDLGIARGMSRYVQLRTTILQEAKDNVEIKKKKKIGLSGNGKKRDWVPLDEAYMRYIAKKFSPHQTVFQSILWRLSDTNIEVLEDKKDDIEQPNPTKRRKPSKD